MELTAARARYRWIVGPRYDLVFFIGSAALTFAFYGLYRLALSLGLAPRGEAVLLTYLVFTAVLDHPHIFQTFSRTHLDREERARRPVLYTWGIAAFVLAGFVATALRLDAYVIAIAAVYGTWHIIRQHWGLLRAYKIVNGDREPIDDVLDASTFYVGMFACFTHDYSGARGPLVIYGDMRVSMPTLPEGTGELMWGLFLVLLVAFGARQTWRAMEGKPINVPKLLLLGAALSTHYFVFFATATPFLVAEALETAYHDVQYQGWIGHFQRRRFPDGARVARRWLVLGLLYGLAVGTVEVIGLLDGGWARWAFTPFAALVIFHYYADGLIWRFREQPELRALLTEEPPRAALAPIPAAVFP